MKKPKNEIIIPATSVETPTVQPQQMNSIDMLISKAVENNVSIETMERLLSMRRELKAEQAKEAFDTDMALFQGECPTIKKTKAGGKTKGGMVAYHYAPLESIVEQTKGLISKYGFSYAIKTDITETRVKATCISKHKMGHSESSDVDLPLTTKTEIMSAPQQVAATITFAKRYAFCNAFGIMTGDDDTDAQEAPREQPKKQQKQTLEQTIQNIREIDDPKYLEEIREKISGSAMYNEPQRRVLLVAIEETLKKIKS